MPSQPDPTEVFVGARPGRRRAETDRLFKILADGEWHDVRDVLSQMSQIVPPGRATRETEYQRSKAREAPRERKIPLSLDGQRASGAKSLAKQSFNSAASRGVLEFDRPRREEGARVRLSYRHRLWSSARLSRHLNRPQNTVQEWVGNSIALAEVAKLCPEGVTPTVPDPFGLAQILFDPASVPAWEKFSEQRRKLGMTTANKAEHVLAAVAAALTMPLETEEDRRRVLDTAGQLHRELGSRGLYIAVRQPSKKKKTRHRVNREE